MPDLSHGTKQNRLHSEQKGQEGNTDMNKQTIEFAVQRTDNIVTRIGRSYISHPEIKFSGGHIKWYEDKPNQQCSNKNE